MKPKEKAKKLIKDHQRINDLTVEHIESAINDHINTMETLKDFGIVREYDNEVLREIAKIGEKLTKNDISDNHPF